MDIYYGSSPIFMMTDSLTDCACVSDHDSASDKQNLMSKYETMTKVIADKEASDPSCRYQPYP